MTTSTPTKPPSARSIAAQLRRAEGEARAQALIAVNLSAPAMAHNAGYSIRGKSPWLPSVTATARIADPLPVPDTCPCCGGHDIACLHHDELHGRSTGIWPWAFVCRSCGASAGLIAFTNIPTGPLASPRKS